MLYRHFVQSTKFENKLFPLTEYHYQGVSTNHREQTGLENYAVITPSVSGDGTRVVCGVIKRDAKGTKKTMIVVYQIEHQDFFEISLDEAANMYDFEGSMPNIDLTEIEDQYFAKYCLKSKNEVPARSRRSFSTNVVSSKNSSTMSSSSSNAPTVSRTQSNQQVKNLNSNINKQRKEMEALEKEKNLAEKKRIGCCY